MHTMLPAILGLIGMMIIYTTYALGYLKASLPVMFLLIIFVVMGCGAMLEMSEFFYDHTSIPLLVTFYPQDSHKVLPTKHHWWILFTIFTPTHLALF
jgi:hypothetical protein